VPFLNWAWAAMSPIDKKAIKKISLFRIKLSWLENKYTRSGKTGNPGYIFSKPALI
jgi:hypothetical protein